MNDIQIAKKTEGKSIGQNIHRMQEVQMSIFVRIDSLYQSGGWETPKITSIYIEIQIVRQFLFKNQSLRRTLGEPDIEEEVTLASKRSTHLASSEPERQEVTTSLLDLMWFPEVVLTERRDDLAAQGEQDTSSLTQIEIEDLRESQEELRNGTAKRFSDVNELLEDLHSD